MSDPRYPGPGWHVGVTRPDLFSRADHDRLRDIILAAIREAGYTTNARWDGSQYVLDPSPPDDVLERARALGLAAIGIEFDWERDE
ncbi:MAG: hypothetical protein ACOYXM_01700 [Actinomycetota bacterium]